MSDYGGVVVITVMLGVGWLCTKRPTAVLRFITAWLELPIPTSELNKSQKMAKYVREHPDTWTQEYPLVYRQIQFTGFAAYFIFAVGLFLMFMSWLVPVAP